MLNEMVANRQAQNNLLSGKASQHYTYPYGLKLRPGTEVHDDLLGELLRLAQGSFASISRRHEKMRKIDDMMTAFIPASELEQLAHNKDTRRPLPLVIPFQYASYEAISTPIFARYALGEEIHQYRGGGPEDRIGAMLAEKVISRQSAHFQEVGVINTAIRDFMCYGFCAAHPRWIIERGKRTRKVPNTYTDPMTGQPIVDQENPFTKIIEDAVVFEGSRVFNLDTYRYLPDPNVPIHLPNDGQFAGWSRLTNRYEVLEREFMDPTYFNARYLEGLGPLLTPELNSDMDAGGGEMEGRIGGAGENTQIDTLQDLEELHLFVKLIPEEWGLGGGKQVEVWHFCVIGGLVIVHAQPLDSLYNKIPISVGAPYSDGYASTPLSGLEVTYGMQVFINHLINTRLNFILLCQYGRWAVDATKVDAKSLQGTKHGLFIKMQRLAYGQRVGDYIQQFPVQDVTQSNMSDIIVLYDWMQRVTGATDPLIGIMRNMGESKTATEAHGAKMSAVGRVDKIARIFDDQFMNPLSRMLLSNTAQYMSQDTYVRMMGRYEEELRTEFAAILEDPLAAAKAEFYPVSPSDIDPYYDVLPSGRSSKGEDQFDMWVQLYGMILNNPLAVQETDTVRMLKHIARLGGAENVGEFVRRTGGVQAITTPDDIVRSQVSAGNLVPLGQVEKQSA